MTTLARPIDDTKAAEESREACTREWSSWNDADKERLQKFVLRWSVDNVASYYKSLSKLSSEKMRYVLLLFLRDFKKEFGSRSCPVDPNWLVGMWEQATQAVESKDLVHETG